MVPYHEDPGLTTEISDVVHTVYAGSATIH